MDTNDSFAKLMKEFGGETQHEEEIEAEEAAMDVAPVQKADVAEAKEKSEAVQRLGAGTGKLEGRLIVAEKRTTGSVDWKGGSHLRTFGEVDTDLLVDSLCCVHEGRTYNAHRPSAHTIHDSDAS